MPVVDPDAIARRIDPDNVSEFIIQTQAAKEALAAIRRHLKNKESFVWETTLASTMFVNKMRLASENGFKTELHFIGLDSWEQSRLRVDIRVQDGGHDIPTDIIQRRYDRTLAGLAKGLKVADTTCLYNNEGIGHVQIGSATRYVLRVKKDAPPWCHSAVDLIEQPYEVRHVPEFGHSR